MNNVKIYILEDEIITQELLKETLQTLEFKVCGMATNAETALKEINKLKPDIAILDIKVEGDKTGIWLGNQLDIPIIYLTAFTDYQNVKDASQTNPISYLQKPFKEKDLFIAIQLAIGKIDNTKELVFKDKNFTIKLKTNTILYAKKEDHYLILFQNDSKNIIRATVTEFLDMVTDDFIQVHRSYVVNKNFVNGFSNRIIKIKDTKIPISLTFLENVKKSLS